MAGDGEVVTGDWLCGVVDGVRSGWSRVYRPSLGFRLNLYDGGRWHAVYLPGTATRGDVRRLAAALNMPLLEGGA